MRNKTAKRWLDIARASGADWVDKAIENIKAHPDFRFRKKNYSHLSQVITDEFFWSNTPEDHEYWAEIHYNIFESELIKQ